MPAATDLPLRGFLDEFLGNVDIGAGIEGPVRVPVEQIAAQLGTLINLTNGVVSVIDKDLATPPVSPTTGDRYIVAASPTGAWAGHANDLAESDGSDWLFTEPSGVAFVLDEFELYGWNAGAIAWQTITSAMLSPFRHMRCLQR